MIINGLSDREVYLKTIGNWKPTHISFFCFVLQSKIVKSTTTVLCVVLWCSLSCSLSHTNTYYIVSSLLNVFRLDQYTIVYSRSACFFFLPPNTFSPTCSMLMEKNREGQREMHSVFVDLGEAWVPMEGLWLCQRKSGVAIKYTRVVQDVYEGSRNKRWILDESGTSSVIGPEPILICHGDG